MLTIRPARTSDASAVAPLLDQLGYPATEADALSRLERLTASRSATVIVAESEGTVVGLATGHLFHAIHSSDVVALLTALVVERDHRRTGAGAALVAAIEAWAAAHGATRIAVTTASHRDDAHGFYARVGYEKTGLRFAKRLK